MVPVKYPVWWRHRVRTLLSAMLLCLTGYFGSIFLLGPMIPLAFCAPTVFCIMISAAVHLWTRFAEVILSGVVKIQVRHFGDPFPSSSTNDNLEGSSIVLLNHRTRLDWLYVWCLGSFVHRLRIVLKAQLGHIPGVGWSMQLANYIFLKRRLAVDQVRIRDILNYHVNFGENPQILIFPEGTNMCPETLEKSNTFADKTGRPRLLYTLHPRHAGFEIIARSLKSSLSYVYDLTIAYPYALPESEISLALGNSPQEVHFYIRRWAADELPDFTGPAGDVNTPPESSSLGEWLDKLWLEKEQLLKDYYALTPECRRFPNELERDGVLIDSVRGPWSLGAGLVFTFWVGLVVYSCLLLYTFWLARIYFVGINIFYLIADYRTGIDTFITRLAFGTTINSEATHPLLESKSKTV